MHELDHLSDASRSLILGAEVEESIKDIAGQLAPTSQRIYRNDVSHFACWMEQHGLTPLTMTRSDIIAYRSYLASAVSSTTGKPYSKRTVQRMFSIACRLMDEQFYAHRIPAKITDAVRGFSVDLDETPHSALSRQQAILMLDGIDRSTAKGKRDYAIIILLIKTGLRRSELVGLNIGDMQMQEGHYVLLVRHGKRNKQRTVKLRVEVHRAIEEYLIAMNRSKAKKDEPLFVGFHLEHRRQGEDLTSNDTRISAKLVEYLVSFYNPDKDHIHLTPHGLRSTFATLAFEGGAHLQQVQFAMGHKDPRITEHYQKRKLNLDNNAVDKLDF